MKKLSLITALLASTAASATNLELRIPGGNFEDCELIDIGSEGSVTGTMLIKTTDKDNRWASAAGLTIVEDSNPIRVFRLSLGNVTNSKRLVAKYEFIDGDKKLMSETIARTDIGKELAYSISWNEHGIIQISVDNSPPRILEVAIKPNRSFILISGAHATVTTAGKERIDCSRAIIPESP